MNTIQYIVVRRCIVLLLDTFGSMYMSSLRYVSIMYLLCPKGEFFTCTALHIHIYHLNTSTIYTILNINSNHHFD